jgi:uncharacterized protein YecT (DUF1311 family)
MFVSITSHASCEGMHGSLQESCLHSEKSKDIEKEMKAAIYYINQKFRKYPQPEYSKLIFKISQDAWKDFRDKQCAFEQHLYGGANSVSFSRCEERMNKERLIELQNYNK